MCEFLYLIIIIIWQPQSPVVGFLLTLLIMSVNFALLSLNVILACAAASLFCICLVSVQVSAP